MKYILLFALILMPIALAQNITLDKTILNGGQNVTISVNSSINLTLVPVACLLNKTIINITNNTLRCDITRTLSEGETFVRDDQSCNIQISAPVCEAEPDNVTRFARWRVEGDEDNIRIIYLQENNTRTFPRTQEAFNYETEFKISCPDLGETIVQPGKINITDDEFRSFCLEPFGAYGEQVTKLNEFYASSLKSKDERIGSLTESNKNLAVDVEECRVVGTEYEELREDYDVIADRNEICQDRLLSSQDESSRNSTYQFLFWFLLLGNVLAFVVIHSRSYAKKLGSEEY